MDKTKLARNTGLHAEILDMNEVDFIWNFVGLTDVDKTLPKNGSGVSCFWISRGGNLGLTQERSQFTHPI